MLHDGLTTNRAHSLRPSTRMALQPHGDVSHCLAAREREREYSNNWRRGKEDTDYV